jgi:fatty acid synthase subunit alpha, fungi type
VMVAGMTPTTANAPFVSAFTNAGFHGELAAGGLPREEIMRETISTVVQNIASGDGVHLNLLFLNSKLWGFQFPLVKNLRQEGVPIDSITIAAGVPSLEKSSEILAELRQSGIQFVSFKPESSATIKLVVEIAKMNSTMKIVIQWTGGRGGGHHSWEDFYQPILDTYSLIREQQNIILVAGSGIGYVFSLFFLFFTTIKSP